MIATRAWAKRNLGFDPISTPAPQHSYVHRAAASPTAEPADLQREIIEFDSEGPEGMAFLGFSSTTGLSRFTEIPWKSQPPQTDEKPRKGLRGALPRADALVVTWTVDEGHALSRVLTPGKDSARDYLPYTHNFATISRKMRKGCPAMNARRLGAYWTTRIGSKQVVIFKSDSHLSQDTKVAPRTGATLPNEALWQQIIEEVQPKLIITTGTAGGIGKDCQVGDVVVSPIVGFDCQKWLAAEPFATAHYKSAPALTSRLAEAKRLFAVNADQLPRDNTRAPKIIVARSNAQSVLTADFFGFDTSNNRYKLQGLGSVSEMGDAILGMAMSRAKKSSAHWLAIRNVSDPQIKAEGTPAEQAREAAQIYKGFGRWSSVCSAIVCWAVIAAS